MPQHIHHKLKKINQHVNNNTNNDNNVNKKNKKNGCKIYFLLSKYKERNMKGNVQQL